MSEPGTSDSAEKYRMHDLPAADRPRERLLRLGAGALSNTELLALFVNTGVPGENALQVAQRLLRKHGGLRHLSRLGCGQLLEEKALGPAKSALLAAAFEMGRRAVREEWQDKPLNTPEDIYELVAPDLQPLSNEVVRVLLVNTRLGYFRQEQISHGSINESITHPRDVIRPALIHAAFGFVLVHNHPSGDPNPSEADVRVTRRVKEAADLMGVKFLDHVIIGAPGPLRSQPYYSFRESSLL